MRRTAAAMVFVLAAGVATAADIHVLKDADRDGMADPCPNPAHRTYYAAESVSCGGTFDIDGDGFAERIYCNLQVALDQFTGQGDTLEIHAGTWTDADTTLTTVPDGCDSVNNLRTLMLVKPCNPDCTQESHRRTIRGAKMLGVSDGPGSAYPAILKPDAGTVGKNTIVLGNRNANPPLGPIHYLTIADLTIQDGAHFGTVGGASCNNPGYLGIIGLSAQADYLVIDNVHATTAPSYDTWAECQFSPSGEVGPAFISNLRGHGDGQLNFAEIKNSRVEACVWWGIKGGNDTIECRFTGLDVHHNTFVAFNEAQNGELKGFCEMAFHENILIYSPSGTGSVRCRRCSGNQYWFNNYFQDAMRFATGQETSLNVYVFNNSFNNQQEEMWAQFEASASTNTFHVRNNSVVARSFSFPLWRFEKGTTGNNDLGFDHWIGRSSYASGPFADVGHYVCEDSDPCGQNASWQDCDLSGRTCAADVPGRPTSGPPPWRISSSASVLVDRGTNDPLGQGPNRCSITLWPGHVIDCTKDFDGDDRRTSGASWDIGADEFAEGSGGPPPPASDREAPSAITDLTAAAPAKAPQLHVTLTWTAPDERNGGPSGQPVASYDVRYSRAPILNDADFAAASPVTAEMTGSGAPPRPLPPGALQSLLVIGLKPNATYYFAIKSKDAAGNVSALSNVVAHTTAKFEGYGWQATGGGEGRVCRVTSLQDSGPGTLRDCLVPSGGRNCAVEPLYVVFDVGGVITLMSDITIDADDCNLTIDGSTAPNPGITIRKRACATGLTSCPVGDPCLTDGEFKIGRDEPAVTNNVILTHLRFQGNYDLSWGACGENSAATLGLQYHFANLVLDHLTIRNGSDSSPDLWTGSWASSNVTISHTLIAWSNHPLTISDSGGAGSRSQISIHHNVLARSGERMPQVRWDTRDLDFRNNIVFDWGANGSGSYGMRVTNDDGATGTRKVHANVVANVFRSGNGNPRHGFYYGTGPGSETSTTDGDGGPSACTTADGCARCPAQGDLVMDSYMGELWVSGNDFPAEVCDRWSTVAVERFVPEAARVRTDPAGALVSTVLPEVGTHYRMQDETDLVNELSSLLGGEAVCGNGVKEAGEECDGTDLGGQTCLDQGFESGTLRCTSQCKLDTSGCTGDARPGPVRNLRRTDKR